LQLEVVDWMLLEVVVVEFEFELVVVGWMLDVVVDFD